MSNKTINQALKDLYTGLGGDPQALADNSTCSDYIEDLESAIKGAASGAQIDDETASTTTVFSSTKTEELIGSIEALPSVAVGDIGEALIVESDGEGGAQWGKGVVPQNVEIFGIGYSTSAYRLLNNKTVGDISTALENGKYVVLIDTATGQPYPFSDREGTFLRFQRVTYSANGTQYIQAAVNELQCSFGTTSTSTTFTLNSYVLRTTPV